MSDIHDDTPTSEELAADIGETSYEGEPDDGLGPIDALIADRGSPGLRSMEAQPFGTEHLVELRRRGGVA